jgi:hypothetical protein
MRLESVSAILRPNDKPNKGFKGVADMFFLFGARRTAKLIGQTERHCSKCTRPTVHSAIESRRWFTLFFVPVIPLGSSYAIRCNLCGLTLKGSPELKAQLSAKAATATATA